MLFQELTEHETAATATFKEHLYEDSCSLR